jgi:hypothetical protein
LDGWHGAGRLTRFSRKPGFTRSASGPIQTFASLLGGHFCELD